MKNIKLFGACAAVALFSACSNEEALAPTEDQVPEGMYKVSVSVNKELFADGTGKKRVWMDKMGGFHYNSDSSLGVIYKGANGATKVVMFHETDREPVDGQDHGIFEANVPGEIFRDMTPTDVYSEYTGTFYGNESEDDYTQFSYTQKNVEDTWNASEAVYLEKDYGLHLHGKPVLYHHINNKMVSQFSATLSLDFAAFVYIDTDFLPTLAGGYDNYHYKVTVNGQEYTIKCKNEDHKVVTRNGLDFEVPGGGLSFFVKVPTSGIENPVIKVEGVYQNQTVQLVTKKHKKLEPAKRYKLGTEEYFATTGTAEARINYSDVDVKWVQLWEDGPKFAEYNVGTSSEYPNGRFYAWGATYDGGSRYTGTGDLDFNDYQNDTAHNIWGDKWRMPTKKELEDLLEKANCTWTDNYKGQGQKGFLCTGKSGTEYESNEVFFPANGYLQYEVDTEATAAGTQGCYWSSTNSGGYGSGYGLRFWSNMNPDFGAGGWCNVRAVLKK